MGYEKHFAQILCAQDSLIQTTKGPTSPDTSLFVASLGFRSVSCGQSVTDSKQAAEPRLVWVGGGGRVPWPL